MKMSPAIDLGRSLRQVFGKKAAFNEQMKHDCARQSETAGAILRRFFQPQTRERRELMILADEVGLGKTYVALAVAVSLLDGIRQGDAPDELPSNRPVVVVLTPNNDALFNKWMREAEAFKAKCAHADGDLKWLQICCPIKGTSKAGNVIDLSAQMRDATRRNPMLLIAKQGVFGGALHDRDLWRRRSLAAVFGYLRTATVTRRYWCRKGRIFDNLGIPELNELLDLRSAGHLWEESGLGNLERAFNRVLDVEAELVGSIADALNDRSEARLLEHLDNLARHALVGEWPKCPLLIIDEVHGLKNEHVQARRKLETFASGKVSRVLGLSATPFQLRHDELLSLLKLRSILTLPRERRDALDQAVETLGTSMKAARDSGEQFRRKWKALRRVDQRSISETWDVVRGAEQSERLGLASRVRPPRVGHAIAAALDLEQRNAELQRHLHLFVIRHQHVNGYREHFVGKNATEAVGRGRPTFQWAPGIEVRGDEELVQYLMMRAVALAKEERGLPGLGAELTGSYRHLVETASVWKKLAEADNPLLRKYRSILDEMIGHRVKSRDPDVRHCKVQATVRRALDFFKRGEKSLVYCVYTKTAEAVRDQLQVAVEGYLSGLRDGVFGDAAAFENFRRRFFNRRESLFALIQDHPLLGGLDGGRVGVPDECALKEEHCREIAEILIASGEPADSDKPDRRLLLAATEHVAVKGWRNGREGVMWLSEVLRKCPELAERMSDVAWLRGREPLSRTQRGGGARLASDPEARREATDPLDAEDESGDGRGEPSEGTLADPVGSWVKRLREDAVGEIIAPYFRPGVIGVSGRRPPLLAEHHRELLAKCSLDTRAVAGQVFRRILMADEFLLRYLADVEKDQTERWAEYLSERYVKRLGGQRESLRERVNAYLETLDRAEGNKALLSGYHAGAENRNVVQIVKGDTQRRDRYFLGFNTPYRPEILVSTSVGQEGIDLHRECRHVVHHDLCWNPATIEQRTGRVDRIGSKVQRDRMGGEDGAGTTLEIAVPYLAATYDERMFEEVYRRAQLFEVTLGGEMRVDARIDFDLQGVDHQRRERLGIGSDDEDMGDELEETGVVDLPKDMIEKLRVDLSVWRP